MIQNILKIKFSKKELLFAAIIILLFIVIRVSNLTVLPIFTDEAIYMRWSQLMWDDPRQRFVSLSDGKQPLQMWVSGAFMKLIDNQLWAARFPLVLCGLLSMIGLYLVAWELFRNKTIAYSTAILYLIAPPFMLHDRLAMADSMLAMWGVWSLYINLLLLRTKRLDIAFILGFIYGLALFTKSPALFFWLLAPLALLLIPKLSPERESLLSSLVHPHHENNTYRFKWKKYAFWKWEASVWKDLGKYLTLWFTAAFLGNAIAAVMRLSELYYMVGRKELEFVVPLDQWLADPFARLYGNMYGMSVWFLDYFGLPLIITFFIGVFVGIIKRDIRIIFLLLISLLPWVVSASRAIVLYPRYLLFFTPPLMTVSVYGFYFLYNNIQVVVREFSNLFNGPTDINKTAMQISRIALIVIVAIYPLYSTTMLLFNPPLAPLPSQDRGQYIEDTPSGYGVPEIIEFLRSEYEKEEKLVVGTEGTFGLMPFALEIEFRYELLQNKSEDPALIIQGYWPFDHVPQRIMEAAVSRPAYFIVYQYQGDIPTQMPLELVKEYKKPGGKKTIRLFKVKPQRYFSGEKFNLHPQN